MENKSWKPTKKQIELISKNKDILIAIEKNKHTISSLSKEIELSYRAVHKRIYDLIKVKILKKKKETKKRGTPVFLEINPQCLISKLSLRFIRTPKEKKLHKEKSFRDEDNLHILNTLKKAGKPLSREALMLNYKPKGDWSGRPEDFDGFPLENMSDYGLVELRVHITRKGSAILKKNKKYLKKPKLSG